MYSFRAVLVILIVVQELNRIDNFISAKNAILPIFVYSLYSYYRILPKECSPSHLDTQCNPVINLMRMLRFFFSHGLFKYAIYTLRLLTLI